MRYLRSFNRFILISLALLGLSVSSQVQSAIMNILVNPGFETGNLNGWTDVGNSFQTQVNADGVPIGSVDPSFAPTLQNVRSGQFAVNSLVRTSPVFNKLILSQSVSLVAGVTYSVGFWVNVDSSRTDYFLDPSSTNIFVNGLGFSGFLELGALGLLSSGAGTGSSPSDFLHVFGSFTSRRTESSASVRYSISGSGSGLAGFSVDDFHFTGDQIGVVPVPAAIWLFGTALIGLVGFGRRRKAA